VTVTVTVLQCPALNSHRGLPVFISPLLYRTYVRYAQTVLGDHTQSHRGQVHYQFGKSSAAVFWRCNSAQRSTA
jgi:hypothetical protein